MMKRIYQLCCAAICSLILAGCGMIDLAYNNAPSIVSSKIDDAFDLDARQNTQLDSRLDQFFVWHREEELIRYQQLLDQAALAAADGITAVEFMELNKNVRLAWRRSLEKAIDSFGDLAVTLTPQQIENYQQYHRKSFSEFKDYLEKSAQQREIFRVARSFDRLEDWYGGFDEFQESKIMLRLQQVPDIYEPWLRYREARQQAFISVLNRAAATGINQAELKAVLLDPSTEYSLAYEPQRQSYWQAFAIALEDINRWLTTEQRQRAVTKLRKYAQVAARLGKRDIARSQVGYRDSTNADKPDANKQL
jgi:ribosomal protein L44E